MAKTNTIRVVGWTSLLVLMVLGLAYGTLTLSVSKSIRSVTAKAQQEHPGNRIDARLAMLHSDTTDVRAKNRVVWALGEIRDARSLPSQK